MQPRELTKKLKSAKPPHVIDVRSAREFRFGHIPTAVHVPFWAVLLRHSVLPRDKDALLVLTCEHGPRAQLAKVLLTLTGRHRIELLDGHMSGWRKAGLPVVS
jgi:rhodanese-related sulfurtransferase